MASSVVLCTQIKLAIRCRGIRTWKLQSLKIQSSCSLQASSLVRCGWVESFLPAISDVRKFPMTLFGKRQEEYDMSLRDVLQRLQENNLRLNEDKCEFSKTEITFYGHTFSCSGIRPDPLKVEAICCGWVPC